MAKRIYILALALSLCLAACGMTQGTDAEAAPEVPVQTETYELAPEAPEQKPFTHDSNESEDTGTTLWDAEGERMYTEDGVIFCNPETDFTVNAVDGGLEISSCSARGRIVAIPSEIRGTPIVSIGSEAFCGKNYQTVYIGTNVTRIGSRAFAECPKLENIYATGDLVSVGEDAITGCLMLEDVILPSNKAFSVDGKIISNCPSLRSVLLPHMEQPEALIDLDTCPNVVVSILE